MQTISARTDTQEQTLPATAHAGLTRALLAGAALAGPLYVGLGIFQMFIREGFDIRRHALSLLSNGDLGWIQIANFMLAGLLTIAGAVGMRRALAAGRGRTWGPLLIALYGLGLIGAGLFVADPALGFPAGTPAGAGTITTAGLLHFVTGGIGFLGLIAASFVFARRFAGLRKTGWALFSLVNGVVFFAAFFGIASGSGAVWLNLAFGGAVVLAWAWITALALRLHRDLA